MPCVLPALIETSCCGMAGSFGYEAAHYEVSMKMAEAALLPKVRAAALNELNQAHYQAYGDAPTEDACREPARAAAELAS